MQARTVALCAARRRAPVSLLCSLLRAPRAPSCAPRRAAVAAPGRARASSSGAASAARGPAGAPAVAAASDAAVAASPPPPLSEAAFSALAERTLEQLEAALVAALEPRLADFDASLSMGVLTLRLGEAAGTYVINKQTPNRQLWWSSPVSGPRRYAYDADAARWRGTRDGHDMLALLSAELTALSGGPVALELVPIN